MTVKELINILKYEKDETVIELVGNDGYIAKDFIVSIELDTDIISFIEIKA